MLRKGMEIKIEGKHARKYHYEPVVGCKGIIIGITPLYVEVNVHNDSFGQWHIQYEDCIPSSPLNNKEAILLLEKEW